MYAVMLLLTGAYGLISGSWLILLPWVHNDVVLWKQMGHEEQGLIKRYGEAYERYMERTGRLWPARTRRQATKVA